MQSTIDTYLRNIEITLNEISQKLSFQKEIFTLEEFCNYSGISKNQAYHLTSSGKVKCYRPFGKMLFFQKDEVVDFLMKNPINKIKK